MFSHQNRKTALAALAAIVSLSMAQSAVLAAEPQDTLEKGGNKVQEGVENVKDWFQGNTTETGRPPEETKKVETKKVEIQTEQKTENLGEKAKEAGKEVGDKTRKMGQDVKNKTKEVGQDLSKQTQKAGQKVKEKTEELKQKE